MTREQAARVVQMLSAAPFKFSPAIERPTAELWIEELTRFPFDLAQGVAKRIIREDEQYPSIARFRSLCNASSPTGRGKPEKCERCENAGMVEVSKRESAWMPCPNCNTETHARWASGDFRNRRSA